VFLSVPGRALGFGTGQVGVQPGLSSELFGDFISFTEAIDKDPVRQWSEKQVEAARWLRTNASIDDLVATNLNFSPFVPALTRLRTLVSGIAYQAPYGRPGGLAILLAREKASREFIDSPSAEAASALCAQQVTWVWVDPTRTKTRSWSPYAEVATGNEDATILRLNCGR